MKRTEAESSRVWPCSWCRAICGLAICVLVALHLFPAAAQVTDPTVDDTAGNEQSAHPPLPTNRYPTSSEALAREIWDMRETRKWCNYFGYTVCLDPKYRGEAKAAFLDAQKYDYGQHAALIKDQIETAR